MSGRKGFCQQSRRGDVLSLKNSFHVLDGCERRHVWKSEQTCCHKCLSQHTCQDSLLCPLCHFHFVNTHLQEIKCLWTAWWLCLTALPKHIQVKMFLFLSPPETRNVIIKDTFFWQTCSVLVCLDNSLTELCTPCYCVATSLCYPEWHW